jgi:uncharacterized protein (TIGR00725 family)
MDDGFAFIGVIGGNEVSPAVATQAETVGREIARRGGTVVCGGMGGVMEAACKGATDAGGLTIGILPGDSRAQANACVRIPIITGIGYARNVAVVRTSQAIIAVDGSYGTLSEIAYALQAGIPVIGLGTWRVSLDDNEADAIHRATTPEEAVEKAFALLKVAP